MRRRIMVPVESVDRGALVQLPNGEIWFVQKRRGRELDLLKMTPRGLDEMSFTCETIGLVQERP